MCDFFHAQRFEITDVANMKSTFVQHSCRNAEVVQAFCRVAASRSDTRRSIHWPSIAALAEMPTALSFPRYADIAGRFVLASRLPSKVAPALNPHSARCLAGAQLPATSCLGAFWTPVSAGLSLLPASKTSTRADVCHSLPFRLRPRQS